MAQEDINNIMIKPKLIELDQKREKKLLLHSLAESYTTKYKQNPKQPRCGITKTSTGNNPNSGGRM